MYNRLFIQDQEIVYFVNSVWLGFETSKKIGPMAAE